jgi:hypothetical protein
MKLRILTIVALAVMMLELTSCANHQYPGSYHQNGRGQARFY